MKATIFPPYIKFLMDSLKSYTSPPVSITLKEYLLPMNTNITGDSRRHGRGILKIPPMIKSPPDFMMLNQFKLGGPQNGIHL
ncbi:unnamed protein product [Allacma fusca]|uniref:Uncharacterized protein n=1 Tax=Allacma fusca TaxID=39272 RepID=A0A8J2L9F3_9HEXA|nr:unnamed protein product [Allacma fusca]